MDKIKTICRTWSRMLYAKDGPGPEVDFDERDVTGVEYCCMHALPESRRTYYLYRKSGLATLAVPHSELERFPKLLARGLESYRDKISGPDPLKGSPT